MSIFRATTNTTFLFHIGWLYGWLFAALGEGAIGVMETKPTTLVEANSLATIWSLLNTKMSMELSNYLVSWVVTFLGDLQPTYIGVIIYLLSTMDIPVGSVLNNPRYVSWLIWLFPGRDLIPRWCGKPFKRQRPGRMWRSVRVWLFVSKVFSTHRTGTHPEKTFTKRLKRGISFIIGLGDCQGWALRVCWNNLRLLRLWLWWFLFLSFFLSNIPPIFTNGTWKCWFPNRNLPFSRSSCLVFFCEDLGNRWIFLVLVIGGGDCI